jgi:hypothetical protein
VRSGAEACGAAAGAVGSVGRASPCDRAPRPTRPRRRAGLGARNTPLATAQADRGTTRRFGGRPPDRGNASPPLGRARDVLGLARAAQAIAAAPAVASVGRCNSPASGPHRRRRDCLRGGGHGLRPDDRNHEQPGMVERVDRSACRNKDTHRSARGRRKARRSVLLSPGSDRVSSSRCCSRSDLLLAMGSSWITSVHRRKPFTLSRCAAASAAMRRRVPASSRSCSSAAVTRSVVTRLSRAGGVRHSRPCRYPVYADRASESCRLRPGK